MEVKIIEEQCKLCNYNINKTTNMKLHMLTKHSTKEDREKHKYYCGVCDTAFFCSLYMEKHMNGQKHKKLVGLNNNKLIL